MVAESAGSDDEHSSKSGAEDQDDNEQNGSDGRVVFFGNRCCRLGFLVIDPPRLDGGFEIHVGKIISPTRGYERARHIVDHLSFFCM